MLRHSSPGPTGFLCALGLLTALAAASSPASAASISYGDHVVAPGVTFEDVRESSATDPVPLYGPPTGFAVGLDFDPQSFAATASGGAQDITDAQLNITLTVTSPLGISSLSVFEAGDYTLAGTGTSATQAFAGAILRVTVTQIDGVNVAPISLTPVNASLGFNLPTNPGVVQPWSLGLGFDVAAQLLGLGFGPDERATQLDLVIDDQLLALSELSSVAFIAKKDFRLDVETVGVPEPTALLLLLGAGLAVSSAARRRR